MRPHDHPVGVLLVNLGSPDAPRPLAVLRYLRKFLSDPRVLDIPRLRRWLLLYGAILPLRPWRSAAAYREIWTPEGSPLVVHGWKLRDQLAKRLGDGFRVELAMRYGRPRVEDALERLVAADAERIVVAPLFPQYSSAATGSALEKALAVIGRSWNVPAVTAIETFYEHPAFIGAVAAIARPALDAFRPDHVLFSYHGLPERQVRKSGRSCLASPSCCDAIGPANRFCYRAHCLATTRALAVALELTPERHSLAFQSRLGRGWLRPFTDRVLPELAVSGVRRLAVLCPAFVADCLETLEEIDIRARRQWQELGGVELLLVPSLNAHPAWVEGLAELVRECAA